MIRLASSTETKGVFACLLSAVLLAFFPFQAALAEVPKPQWAEKQLQLIRELGLFISELKSFQRPDGTLFSETSFWKADDEVEYFYYFPAYSYVSGDPVAYDFYKDEVLYYWHTIMNGDQNDGYFGPATFDTEHTLEALMGLANLALIDPDDLEVTSRLEDLVEHVGNWDPEVPAWYNPHTGHLKTTRFGTETIYIGCPEGIDSPWNLRFVNLVLAAYLDHYNPENNGRYDAWMKAYLDGWIDAKRRNAYDVIPSSVNPQTGDPGGCGQWYEGIAGSWIDGGFPYIRSSRQAFLGYWMLSGQEKYLDAAKEMFVELMNQGDGVCPASRYDGARWEVDCEDDHIARLAVQAALQDGKSDEPFDSLIDGWFANGQINEPIVDIWRFRKTGDTRVIVNKHLGPALDDIIQKRGLLERIGDTNEFENYLKDHCSGKNMGDKLIRCFSVEDQVTALAFSAFGGFRPNEADLPWMEVKYFRSDGSLGLPEGVAALVAFADENTKRVLLYNDRDRAKTVRIQAEFLPKEISGLMVNGSPSSSYDGSLATVTIEPKDLLDVEVLITASPQGCRMDLDQTGHLDVLDLQLLISAILMDNPDDLCADLNDDGEINVLDLQILIDGILGG